MKSNLVPLKIIALAGNKTLRGRIRLQKLVFLSQIKAKEESLFYFEPAPFGPLSNELNDAVSQLASLDLIDEIAESTSSGNDVYCYKITDEGSLFLETGIKAGNLPSALNTAIESVYDEFGQMPYVELLEYVHNKYPDFKLEDFEF